MAEEEKKRASKIPVLRTMKSDAAIYASEEKLSVISMASAAIKRRRLRKSPARPEHRGLKLLIIVGVLIFLVLGIAAFFYFPREKEKPRSAILPPPSLIASDEEKIVGLNPPERDRLILKSREALSARFGVGTFRVILFTQVKNREETFLGLEEFLKISDLKMPLLLRDNLRAFSLGSLRAGGAIHPFLIFRVSSYQRAFAAALEWEQTMINDMRIFFADLPRLGERNLVFEDRIVRNQDARVLEYEGQAVLVYAFFNQKLLILSDSERALAEIISRYKTFPPRID